MPYLADFIHTRLNLLYLFLDIIQGKKQDVFRLEVRCRPAWPSATAQLARWGLSRKVIERNPVHSLKPIPYPTLEHEAGYRLLIGCICITNIGGAMEMGQLRLTDGT